MFIIATLYKFTEINDAGRLQKELISLMKEQGVKGTIIVAIEGINGTVAGSHEAINQLKKFLENDGRFFGMEYKESCANFIPFKYIKVKLKKEIVTLGRSLVNPRLMAGEYVNAEQWNNLIKDPEVTVLDVRNDFEVNHGSFINAINPKTKSFRDFVAFVENNLSPSRQKIIAMSCTGGVRCEKASALMRGMGFLKVFHLKGGILQYLKDMPKEKSLFRGQCFVFDERIAVDGDVNSVARD